MTTYRLDPRLQPPTAVPLKQWQYDLFWSLACLLCVGVIVGVVATARTTGGKAVGGLLFGLLLAACLGIWINQRRHPGQLQVSYDEITRTDRGLRNRTVLHREDGPDLVFTLIRMQRGALWALVQPGGDTRLDVQNFRIPDLQRALEAHGWRVLDGKHPRGWA
jgi:hypothetical protein